jgi:hypothetical protein
MLTTNATMLMDGNFMMAHCNCMATMLVDGNFMMAHCMATLCLTMNLVVLTPLSEDVDGFFVSPAKSLTREVT